jgi:predicted acyltransferase
MNLQQERLASLDAFRGFTIAAMVLVNNPGDWNHLYGQLDHATWNGWTFTDTIFPFFLFIGGVSMALSLGRLAEAGADKPALLRKLAWRAVLIFLIGLTLNLIPNFNFATVRIPGVLQRIAVCTLLAAPIVVYLGWRAQLAVIAALLALYSGLMLFVAVPDAHGVWSAGSLEPGRDFGAFVDRWLLEGHLWAKSKTWDPEGLVSTLPALCSQLAGVLAGRWLRSGATRSEQTVWMMLGGLACLALGSTGDALLMPINKSLWTPSYAVWMTGVCRVLLAARRQSRCGPACPRAALEQAFPDLRHECPVHLRLLRLHRQDAWLYQISPAGRQHAGAGEDVVCADRGAADRSRQRIAVACAAVRRKHVLRRMVHVAQEVVREGVGH